MRQTGCDVMYDPKRWLLASLLLALLTLAACQNPMSSSEPEVTEPRGPTVTITELAHNSQCGFAQPHAAFSWIASEQDLQDLTDHSPLSVDRVPSFNNNLVLAVFQGEQPTLGYSIRLAHKEARLDGERLLIEVERKAPGPLDLAAQAMSSPCVLLVVPAQYEAHTEVVDQAGERIHLY